MSNLFKRHCDQDLVRYLDGDLSPREASNVERHLEQCAQCRAELEEFKSTLAECVRYQAVLKAQSPEAPQPWRDLYLDFSGIDESLANDSLLVRLKRPLVHSGAFRWSLVTGLAVLIVLVSLHQLRQTPSVEAASILRKAEQISASRPRPARRVRVRTSRQREFLRPAVVETALAQAAGSDAVAALFSAANFDWNDPLTARAFEQWRDRQVHKTDAVTTGSAPMAYTRIKTTSEDGELASATITLSMEDYEPSEEYLEFRNHDWVELSEISEADVAGGSMGRHVDVPVRAAEPPSRPAALPPGSPASISDELQVLSAISSIGADLGESVEVALADGKVKVTGGDDITPQRQKQIRDALAGLSNVEVGFTPAQPISVPPQVAVAARGADGSAAPAVSATQSRLQKQLGGHAEFDRFSTQVLDLDDGAMQHVYALRRLAQKFSPADEAQFSAQDLNLWHELTRKQTAKLLDKVSGMERLLVPTLAAIGGSASNVQPAAHSSWQPAAEEVYRDARRVELLVSQMFAMTPDTTSANVLPSQLLTALKDLHANLDECQKFLQ